VVYLISVRAKEVGERKAQYRIPDGKAIATIACELHKGRASVSSFGIIHITP
jgi:hypothetical protein